MSRARWLIAGLIAVVCTLGVMAQDITPIGQPANPNFAITFPPPVYVLNGTIDIRGSANVPSMGSYFIEFRPLVLNPGTAPLPTPDPDSEAPWFPATLPQTSVMQDGVLGRWNTMTAPDGLYEMRLTINMSTGEQQYFRVSPLRINNTTFAPVQPPVQLTVISRPTLAATPTSPTGGLPSGAPRVTAVMNANVREGDSTAYNRIGTLLNGQSADIIGRSPNAGRWYYIRLSNGQQGFIAPSTVSIEGDVSGVPSINPPPMPTAIPTAIPTRILATAIPTALPTSVSTGSNLAIQSVTVDPVQPICNQSTLVTVKVVNNGTGVSPAFSIGLTDRRSADGSTTASTRGAVPALNAGASFTSEMYLTINTFYSEAHTFTIAVDSGNQVIETNEGDNVTTYGYNLAQGTC